MANIHFHVKRLLAWGGCLSLSLLSGCASSHNYEPQDPLQTINRPIFAFNDQFDRFILLPLAKTYKFIVPVPIRDCVNNFYHNVGEVGVIGNDLLQLQPKNAATSFGRLVVNSTAGFLGIFDVATYMGWERHENDFGITLGTWGFTSSPYLVIPFLGPTNARDGLGIIVDYTYLSVWPYIESVRTRNQFLLLDYIRIRSNYIKNQDLIDVASFDKYTLIRDAYIQHRALELRKHNVQWEQYKYYRADGGNDEDWAIENGGNSDAMPPLANNSIAADEAWALGDDKMPKTQ